MTEKLLKVNEASELLGIPVGSLRNMVARREIPFIRAGARRVRFTADALMQWAQDRAVEPKKD